MSIAEWNKAQINDALGSDNRYFFWKRFGKTAKSDKLLVLYFIKYGAKEFREKHQLDEYAPKKVEPSAQQSLPQNEVGQLEYAN